MAVNQVGVFEEKVLPLSYQDSVILLDISGQEDPTPEITLNLPHSEPRT